MQHAMKTIFVAKPAPPLVLLPCALTVIHMSEFGSELSGIKGMSMSAFKLRACTRT